MKKSDVQDALLDEFSLAEARRTRARTKTAEQQHKGAKKAIASVHERLFGTGLEVSDEQRSKSR